MCRCLLMDLSMLSAVVRGTSNNIKCHMSLGSSPCWKKHALYFPGRPISIFLVYSAACLYTLLMLLVSFIDASNHNQAQVTTLSNATKTQRALTCGCSHSQITDKASVVSIFSPRVFLSAALMIRFIRMTNKMSYRVQPVTIPSSKFCHEVVKYPTEKLSWIDLN